MKSDLFGCLFYRKKQLFLLCSLIFCVSFVYKYFWVEKYSVDYEQFLVFNRQCRVSNLDPFNYEALQFFQLRDYVPCTDKPLLTAVRREESRSVLYLNQEIAPSYCKNSIFSSLTCCYSNVSRKYSEEYPDDYIRISSCEPFSNEIDILNDVVMVKCKCGVFLTYENVHMELIINEKVKKKMVQKVVGSEPVSVLFVGIDSVSRLNFIRALPKTYKYVEEEDWFSLKAYNKIDDNTFPNLMAILTGHNDSHLFSKYNPKKVGMLDKCPILWKEFAKFGYITGFAEDEASLSTFNYKKRGFVVPPTDYYMRPYILATEELSTTSKHGMTYCSGPENAGERIMNVAKNFAVTFNSYPHFGFFWMNSFSHNELNAVSAMDEKIEEFLRDLKNNNVTNSSIVIFLSDHGMRFGNFRYLTKTGWLEERLPFIYVWFPPWFKKKFPTEVDNFRNNAHKLTTPYDLYMTLQHLLVLSGFNYKVKPSSACPNCKSLFELIEWERSCQDAGIAQHWCTCTAYSELTLQKSQEEMVVNYVLNEIQKITSNAPKKSDGGENCAKYKLGAVLSTSVAVNSQYILIKLETVPKAVFEATVIVEGDISHGNYSCSGDISRLDYYGDHSQCVEDAFIKKYCYCT